MSNEEFISSIAPYAVLTDAVRSVPASVIMAQAIQETGYGSSYLAKEYKNLFGIKTSKEDSGKGVVLPTTEYRGGMPTTERHEFRTYSTWAGSFWDHADFLQKPRYEAVTSLTPENAVRHLQDAGYATDPFYAENLKDLIEQHDLKKYDRWADVARVAGIIMIAVLSYLIFQYFKP